ncbi:IcmT-like type IV secretion system protein [Xanthomonas cissicola]|nr:IcmT-like type IV secretion system protein [Xanthomonas cissicola]
MMSGPADWRNTSLMAKFLIFDARACIPFVILFYSPSFAKLGAAIGLFLFFSVLSFYKYTLVVLVRRVRCKLAGPVRSGVAWWHRPQRRLYRHR